MRYKVGDRVRITTDKSKSIKWNKWGEMDKWLGKVMTIRDITAGCYSMEEDYNEYLGGWFWYEDMIDGLADEHKIVITTDGKITKARLYNGKKIEKTATAKCSPEDEFDFRTGAELAVERLFGKKRKPTYFTGKAVFIQPNRTDRTQGKIYEFVDGRYVDDVDCERPIGRGGYSEEELRPYGFLPIKE